MMAVRADGRSNGVVPLTKTGLLLLVAIALFAGAWRAVGLERESLNMDEIRQAEVARGGKSYQPPAPLMNSRSWLLVALGAADQQQPPLEYFLQRFPNQFSSSEAAQRFPACIWGTMAVFLTGLLGALLGGVRVGVVAALLISLSPLQIEMSRYARPYTIAHFLWLITILVAYWAYRHNTRRGWIGLAVTAFLFLTTRGDLPLFALSAIGGFFVLNRCWKGIAALLVAGMAYLPLFLVILRDGTEWVGQPVAGNGLHLLRAVAAVADPLPIFLLPLALVGVWALKSNAPACSFIILCGLTLAFHLAFWFAFITWPLTPRYLFYASTPFAILGAFGFWFAMAPLLRFRNSQSIVFAILFAVLVALALRMEQLPSKESWRDAALLARRHGINHIWMFNTGEFPNATNAEFYGDWYYPITCSNPFAPNAQTPSGKLAILVLQDPPYDQARGTLFERMKNRMVGRGSNSNSIRDSLIESNVFEHFRLYRMDMYVPRQICSPRCTLDGALTILSRQSGFPELRREALKLTNNVLFQ